jgi:NADH:ubiquinone oxidoreductase subunit H
MLAVFLIGIVIGGVLVLWAERKLLGFIRRIL